MKLPKDKQSTKAFLQKGKEMACKHRSLLVLIVLLVLYATMPQSIAEEEAYSARLGPDDAPNEMTVYFSMGCSHCLEFLKWEHRVLSEYIDKGRLKVELIEVPGIVNNHQDPAIQKKAEQNTMPVSKTFACIAEENPDKALEYLGRFVKNAKVVFHGSADAWKLWPYATSEHVNPSADSPFFNADAKDVQAQLARFFFLDSEAKGKNCMSVADQKRLNAKLEAQLKRFKDEGHSSVPVVIMNGEAMPHDKNFYGTFMRRVKF